MNSQIKTLKELLVPEDTLPAAEWGLKAVRNDQCLSYVAYNERTREALLIDPKDEDLETYRSLIAELRDYLWLGVIDTHTHADHISIAAMLADELKVPLIMHADAPSRRVHIRVSKDSILPSRAAPIRFFATPGHTPDSMTVVWGPFVFGGDTILFGDTGRDDLPGGDAEQHYESIQTLKAHLSPEAILLPGHDHRGGRASSWATQMKINASLTQGREDFVQEAGSFDAPPPKLLKQSLKENFK